MKYIVMECHYSYAVVLDVNGEFLSVANLNYEVGQTVKNVIQIKEQQNKVEKKKNNYKWLTFAASMAACLVIFIAILLNTNPKPYGKVYMAINPEVCIDVDENDMVIGVNNINEDGKILLEKYIYENKKLDVVIDELIERAIEMDYLHGGGKVTLTFDAENNEWIINKSDEMDAHLHEYFDQKISIDIEITNKKKDYSDEEKNNNEYTPSPNVNTDYFDSDYDDLDDVTTDNLETTPEVSSPNFDSEETINPDVNKEDSNYDDSDYDLETDPDDDENYSDYDHDDSDYLNDRVDGETDYGE